MRSLKLSGLIRRNPDRPSLRQRADALRATAAKVIRRPIAPVPNDRHALKEEGERLLRVALREMDRQLDDIEHASDAEKRSHETRLRRELRIDALMALSGRMDPSDKPLPEPGSAEAMAAFHAACSEADRLADPAVHGYPELRRGGLAAWTLDDLVRALEAGEMPLGEYVRLRPMAEEREARIEAAARRANIHVLFALAYPSEVVSATDATEVAPDAAERAIERHREAYAAWLPHLDAQTDARGGTPEYYAAEHNGEPFRVAEVEAFEALLETIPASLSGALALADYLPGAVRRDGRIDEGDLGLQALDTICNGLKWLAGSNRLTNTLASIEARDLAIAQGHHAWSLDLSSISFNNLTLLYGELYRASDVFSAILNDDGLWDDEGHDYTPGGALLDAESNRIGCLRDAIAEELERRRPTTADDRDSRLSALVMQEMRCEGRVRDRALLAEINAAWGA